MTTEPELTDDPYEDHSFWMIRFWCDKCGKELPYSSAVHEECTIPWYQEQARFARSEGWVIFGEEHASYKPLSAWCVHCVERLGFSHPQEGHNDLTWTPQHER